MEKLFNLRYWTSSVLSSKPIENVLVSTVNVFLAYSTIRELIQEQKSLIRIEVTENNIWASYSCQLKDLNEPIRNANPANPGDDLKRRGTFIDLTSKFYEQVERSLSPNNRRTLRSIEELTKNISGEPQPEQKFPEDPHEGMIHNAFNDTWGWGF